MKIKALIFSNKGETLIESVISLLVFSVLLATVTVTVMAALNITRQSAHDARIAQIAVNDTIDGTYVGVLANADDVTITFRYTVITPGETPADPPVIVDEYNLPISHNVFVNRGDTSLRIAFRPQ